MSEWKPKSVAKEQSNAQDSVLLQLRLRSKDLSPLSPYEAWELLQKALANHPKMKILQAEFRVRDDEKTSI